MQTTRQQTSAKPDLFKESPTRGSNTHEEVHILAIVVEQTKELLYIYWTQVGVGHSRMAASLVGSAWT